MLRLIAGKRLANVIPRPIIARPGVTAVLVGVGICGCAHYTAKPLVPEQTGVTLESRSLSDPGLRAFIEKSLGRPLADWPLQTWNLDLLTLVAFYNSPELDVSRARWSAADAAVVTAGMRPNPSLNIAPASRPSVSCPHRSRNQPQ